MKEGDVRVTCLKEERRGLLSLSSGYQIQLIILLKPRSHGIPKAMMSRCLMGGP